MLRQTLKRAGLSQAQFCDLAGVGSRTVDRYLIDPLCISVAKREAIESCKRKLDIGIARGVLPISTDRLLKDIFSLL